MGSRKHTTLVGSRVFVELEQPLGERRVVDGSADTDDSAAATRPEGVPS